MNQKIWKPINEYDFNRKDTTCIVTNNIKAVDAHGQMSHIWIVSMIHKNGGTRKKPTYSAFNDATMPFSGEIFGLTHFMELPTSKDI